MATPCGVRKTPFLFGVFLIAFSILVFQILQTRILSVIAWYYMAFFAISVAMLGMTVGAVWAYLRREALLSVPLPRTLSRFALLTAVAMPASMILQFSLVTSIHPSLITVIAWSLLVAAMAIPYVFSGVAVVAVVLTILVPLQSSARNCPRPLVVTGSLYFPLIGPGFMLAEIALLQAFSVYLGHPVYSLGVCLFSLILASGLGSMASEWFRLRTRAWLAVWGAAVVTYLVLMAQVMPMVFHATTDRERLVRIAISLASIMPLGYLLGFAFPTGMRLIQSVDDDPSSWFWGINGAASVLASVLAVICSMSLCADGASALNREGKLYGRDVQIRTADPSHPKRLLHG
jgi:hypothetical protein